MSSFGDYVISLLRCKYEVIFVCVGALLLYLFTLVSLVWVVTEYYKFARTARIFIKNEKSEIFGLLIFLRESAIPFKIPRITLFSDFAFFVLFRQAMTMMHIFRKSTPF